MEDIIDVDDIFLRKVRKMIFREGEDRDFYHTYSTPLMVIGTFCIIIGWSILNAVSGYGTHSLNSNDGRYSAEVAFLNTFLAGSTSGFLSMLIKRHVNIGDHAKTPRYDIRSLCNGFLAGMAAVSAGSGAMKPWAALITGGVEALCYSITCFLMKKVKFDDAMENYQIYGSASFWAMVSSTFFLPDEGVFWGGKDAGSILGI